jgi:hypothetical protein
MSPNAPRVLAVRALHLVVLWAFAVAQPLFDLLGDTPEFFVVRGSTTVDIVAFGLALVLVPPLLLLALEAASGLAHPRAPEGLHLLFVALLAALIAMQALKRIDGAGSVAVFAGAAVVGAAIALLYHRRGAVRSFLSVLVPAPAIFLALFLLNSPLEKLSLESEALATSGPPVQSSTPVVLVVFDELPVTSLMDERGRVDRGRYPSFASLAADATWFRNATTVHEHTTEAVPAILTGNDPEPEALPLLRDHPHNLFTFLGESHAMHAFEPVTQLCPIDLCPRAHPSFPGRMASLTEDVSLVYLHILLPEAAAADLPSVTDTWQNFGREHADEQLGAKPLAVRNAEDIDRAVGRELWGDVPYQAEHYALSVDAGEQPTLYFLHAMLPHSPWRFLPSGRQYAESLGIEGLANDRWGEDEWLVTQGWQRHLLQVGFTDRLLGLLLDRLREEDVYDDALIVVTADHGVSFTPGDRRRGVTPSNVHDIASVPLFVKRPAQQAPRIVDRPVRSTDIVPTIADVLGAALPWEPEGVSVFESDRAPEPVSVEQRVGHTVVADPEDVARRKDETVARMTSLFGSGSWDGVYGIGPNARLVGRAVESLGIAARGAMTASLATETLFRSVDLDSSLSPSHVHGRLEGEGADAGVELAVAVHGRIAAVTRSYAVGDDVRFDAWVPDSIFREGENDVAVYAVVPETGARALARLGGTGDGAGYELADSGTAITTAEGSEIVVRRGAVDGEVEDWFFEQDTVRIGGWAGVIEERVPADVVLVFADGELAYSGSPSVGRADLAGRYPGLGRSGFVAQLPRDVVDEEDAELRFFAIENGVASELAYDPSFPWKP